MLGPQCGEALYNVTSLGNTEAHYVCQRGHRATFEMMQEPDMIRLLDQQGDASWERTRRQVQDEVRSEATALSSEPIAKGRTTEPGLGEGENHNV